MLCRLMPSLSDEMVALSDELRIWCHIEQRTTNTLDPLLATIVVDETNRAISFDTDAALVFATTIAAPFGIVAT